jgi:gamma-glutamyl-gamma-aminobutyrate hydrolase PuuD
LNIGLTQRILFHKNRAYDCIEHGWYSYLVRHTLSFVKNTLDQDFEKLADSLDALIITGGDDSALRRTVELRLASLMMTRKKPILGVCHGCFLLTETLGGTIYEVYDHDGDDHEIISSGKKIMVNSYHSLAILKPHEGATVLATDSADNCEAWIDKNLAGVVWHPERMETPWLPTKIQNLLNI